MTGVSNKKILSTMPRSRKALTPMKMKTPYKMLIGMCIKIVDKKIDKPMQMKVTKPVILCSKTPINFGACPGAVESSNIFKDWT